MARRKTAGLPVILCVHPNVELYGSDRSFVQVVAMLRSFWPKAILRVVLTGDGPIKPLVEAIADEVVIQKVGVLRRAALGQTIAQLTLGFPALFLQASRNMRAADFVYLNTAVMVDYMLAARLSPDKVAIHVREIPRPRALHVIRGILRAAGCGLIFNSHATSQAFAIPRSQRQIVVHNGVDPAVDPAPLALPAAFTSGRPLRVAMLGRINDWKGQDVLIDAVARLTERQRERVRVRIVGSTYLDVQTPIDDLHRQIAASGLRDVVTIESFQPDPSAVYRWSDLVAVPSKLPEPFGRVATEAMAHARPVVAAASGGLTEIVEDGATGWLVPPADVEALSRILAQVLDDPSLLSKLSVAALARFSTEFSTATLSERLREIVEEWIPSLGAASS